MTTSTTRFTKISQNTVLTQILFTVLRPNPPTSGNISSFRKQQDYDFQIQRLIIRFIFQTRRINQNWKTKNKTLIFQGFSKHFEDCEWAEKFVSKIKVKKTFWNRLDFVILTLKIIEVIPQKPAQVINELKINFPRLLHTFFKGWN